MSDFGNTQLRSGFAARPPSRYPVGVNMTISMWSSRLFLRSPSGLHTAEIKTAETFDVSSRPLPTQGALHLSDGRVFQCCNPSAVWSEDSKYLAIPQWKLDRDEKGKLVTNDRWVLRLLVISMDEKSHAYGSDEYFGLELDSFGNGVVHGKHHKSPKENIPIEVSINCFDWNWQ